MKPAVVLLHSSMSTKAQWGELVSQLSDGYRCIAVDLLGYGSAPFPAQLGPEYRHTLAHEIDAVNAAVAAHLQPGEAFHLIGHSYGGASALHMARRMPERVLSLTVYEPVAFHLLPEQHPARAEIVAVVERIKACAEAQDATRIFIDYWNRTGSFDAAPAAAQAKMAGMIAKVKRDFEALLGEPATLEDLAALTMPALVMSGLSSPASTRLLAEQLAQALPNATALQTRGGHMGPITHAAVVNPAIISFLSDAEITAG
ncbi:alpha/beta fold hydrolase [Pseudoduganella sp. FT93W]|uniref:Alpha/beta fold hydrolase n=2 Tax=Duganella fentianensis TaxID=2692177 RepID=A0A845I542_9BURK|nr:alpha/beta fold hydrolase [Duganella fentianensis]